MFDDFFTKTFYGNSVTEWLLTAVIIVVSLVLGKLLYWLFSKVIKKLTRRTKTKLDDIIVDKVEEPLVFAFVLGGVWYGLSFLSKGEGMGDFLGSVYYILIIFNVAWMIIRLFDALVQEYLEPAVEKSDSALDDQLLPIFRKGMKGALWTIAIILGLNNAGYDVGALLAGLGIGGLAFALAAQDLVKNLFGGFTIFVDKPFTIGDRIKVAEYDGIVEEIGIRNLRIRTLEGRLVIIPNSGVANDAIENVTSEPNRKVVLTIGLTYNTSDEKMDEALDVLKEVANKNDKLVDADLPEDAAPDDEPEKKLIMGFSGFGDFSLNILFIYYIKAGESYLGVQNDINLAILREFNKRKLDFAFPTQTIITKQDEKATA